ncbi:MAG: hypothetical protein QXO21_03600 [Candidatus Anstonellales archaeon]
MIIGIPKETKLFETRVALIPEHVKILVKKGHVVLVEKNAGEKIGFTDNEYKKNGAKIVSTKEVYKSQMIVRVKRPQIKTLKSKQIILGYLHVEKGENPPLLKALINKKITAYAYHLFKNEKGERLINLGYEAGVVGMYEGLRLWGTINKKISKKGNKFSALPSTWELKTEKNIVETTSKILKGEKQKPVIYIMGNGLVAKGCKRILNQVNIPYFVLYKEDTKNIDKYLPRADIIVNATYWLPGEPHIITKEKLKMIKKTCPIVDISCEEHGAVETTVEKSWGNPIYTVNDIYHFAVGNLPSALGRDSSIHLSNMIINYVIDIAENKLKNTSGLLTINGKYVYKLPKIL